MPSISLKMHQMTQENYFKLFDSKPCIFFTLEMNTSRNITNSYKKESCSYNIKSIHLFMQASIMNVLVIFILLGWIYNLLFLETLTLLSILNELPNLIVGSFFYLHSPIPYYRVAWKLSSILQKERGIFKSIYLCQLFFQVIILL